ncbi:MAG TPA: hypothetical protein HA277_03650 [Methanosphaera sp.]|nr:hypothetical protein [Methanosphaera sp.]HIJ15477.1 hypothetical protein [Methanosphaera sp.]
MKIEIMEFFTESAKVITNPDDLFYIKTEGDDKHGILALIFYSLMLALVLGIATGDIVMAGMLLLVFLFLSVFYKFVQALFAFIFARILGGSGSFINTFNLMSYSSVLNIFIIVGIALLTLGFGVIFPIMILVVLWKMVIEIIAVSEEHSLGYAKSFLSTAGIPLIIFIIVVFIGGLV